MRRGPFILLLLIVLMALRGLVGPAMAAGMALPHAAVAKAVASAPQAGSHAGHAAHGDHAPHSGHGVSTHADASAAPPCHDMATAAPSALAPHPSAECAGSSASAHAAHAACADCEICHTAVLAATPAAAPPPGRHADRAPASAARFASAGAALAIKPPIS